MRTKLNTAKQIPAGYLRDGLTVYSLSKFDINKFSALVQAGFNDDGKRTSNEELVVVARNFEAALDLLAACQRFLDAHAAAMPEPYGGPRKPCCCGPCDQARAAIAKAEGR